MYNDENINYKTISIRLLFLSLPLLLNDFYLPLVPRDNYQLNLILDLIIYFGWQTSIIYFAYQAKWFKLSDLGISFHKFINNLFGGILLLIILFIFVLILTFICKTIEHEFGIKIPSIWYFPVPKWHPFFSFIYVVYLAITAGIFEEIIYRGIVIKQINLVTDNTKIQILVSSLLFTTIHWSLGPGTWMISFSYGILWGYLYIKYKSLLPIMISHFLFDVLTIYQIHEIIIKFILN